MAAQCLFAGSPAAQTSSIITMDQEPHHLLFLHNDSVKVLKVDVAPGDSILLYRLEQGTVAIAVGEQEVNVGIAGLLDVPQSNAGAQVIVAPDEGSTSTVAVGSGDRLRTFLFLGAYFKTKPVRTAG